MESLRHGQVSHRFVWILVTRGWLEVPSVSNRSIEELYRPIVSLSTLTDIRGFITWAIFYLPFPYLSRPRPACSASSVGLISLLDCKRACNLTNKGVFPHSPQTSCLTRLEGSRDEPLYLRLIGCSSSLICFIAGLNEHDGYRGWDSISPSLGTLLPSYFLLPR